MIRILVYSIAEHRIIWAEQIQTKRGHLMTEHKYKYKSLHYSKSWLTFVDTLKIIISKDYLKKKNHKSQRHRSDSGRVKSLSFP